MQSLSMRRRTRSTHGSIVRATRRDNSPLSHRGLTCQRFEPLSHLLVATSPLAKF